VLTIIHAALSHLTTDATRPPELVVRLWDSASTGVPIPDVPDGDAVKVQDMADDRRVRSAYHAVPRILSVYDPAQRLAVVWVPDAASVPSNELASPLRTLLHWWSRDFGLQFVHGGAVSVAGRGVLLAGPSGAGKSTAAIACLLGDLDYLGDDYVLVGGGSVPVVHSLYSAGKLQAAHIGTFPELLPMVENADELPTEKALWFFGSQFPQRMATSARAVAVLVPEVTAEGRTTIVRLRPAAALAALAPSTIVQLSGADQGSLSAIGAFLSRVPSYRLRTGTDVRDIARAVRAFIDERPVAQ
jgi:hypothetical protein